MADEITGLERQILSVLEPIELTLQLLFTQDRRVGAKILYGDQGFSKAISNYYRPILDHSKHHPLSHAELNHGVTAFLNYVQGRFPEYGRRMVTELRNHFGKSLSQLYKNSIVLKKLLDAAAPSDDINIVPLILPDQQSSLIYTKVEHDRVVLDSGHPLHPFLRKEAIAETRQYLRDELAEIDKALKTSNVDRKYVEAFSQLSELIRFKDDAGAISFGLHIKMISHLTKKIEEELSEILNVQIASTLTHSAYFASQYKDWMEFVHNAQSYPPRDAIENRIEAALADVTETLQSNPHTVDERIPHSISVLLLMLSDGNAEDRMQAIYAGVRRC